MNAIQAKQIKIADYLHTQGINPKDIKGNDYWYYSPFRNERTASFKVNSQLNVWKDYGSGEGGNILDLVMKLHSIPNISETLAYLSGRTISTLPTCSFSFQQQKDSSGENNSLVIRKIQPISNPILINYISSRKIDLELAKCYCDEVYYQIREKNYFAVGFKNDNGGYELSYKPDNHEPIKSASSPKNITTFKTESDSVLVFEGFWDFLSALQLKKICQAEHNVVVLNSVANLSKAIDFIKSNKKVYTYLDNDEVGRKATQEIKSACKFHSDQSIYYNGYKDLNDFLTGKRQTRIQVKHPSKGLMM